MDLRIKIFIPKSIILNFFILSYLFFGSALQNSFGQCISYDVHACIDYMDDLHFQGTQLWWTHPGGGSPPGTHSSCSGDVLSVNGTPWGAWSTPFTVSGNTTCMDMTAVITQNSNAAYLTQTASSSNGWETIYRFDDSGPSAAHPYKIVFTFCPTTTAPTLTFTVSSPACAGNPVNFTYTGTASSTSTYNWDFGDGSPHDTIQSPSHIYVNPGTFNVSLDVTNECNVHAGPTIVGITISIPPTSTFTAATPVCIGDNSTITYTGSGAPGDIYTWGFGSATIVSAIGQGPDTVNWLAAGTQLITLSVNENGCISPLTTDSVLVIAPKTSTFTASTPVCRGAAATVTYTGNASANANYFWDFDGGTIISGSGQGPYTVNWSTAGTYNLTLTVTENNCPSALTTVQQVVESPPHSNFSFTDVCLNQAIDFNDLSSFSGGTITTLAWNFGNNSPVNNTPNPVYTYSTAGTYQVSLIATNNFGCTDTISDSVTVHPLPQTLFSAVNVCDGSFVQFNSLSTILSPDVIQLWSWQFGDGSSVNNQNTSHLYGSIGMHTAQLLTVSDFGCKDSISKTIVVNPNPVVKFAAAPHTAGCAPLCVNFVDSSTISTGNKTLWAWNVGDGSAIGTSSDFEHCYVNTSVDSTAHFTVSLTVTSDSGCVATDSKNNYINVYPNPKAEFSVEPSTASFSNPVIAIADLSAGATLWKWNFGDSDTSNVFSPSPHNYADTGTFIITLIVSTQYNCKDTAYQTITIEPDFVFYIPNAFSPDGDHINDTFSGKGLFMSQYEMRIFDRWGNLIFFTDDINIPWDGKANHGADIAPRDVYVYSIAITDIKKKKHEYSGIVTLVR